MATLSLAGVGLSVGLRPSTARAQSLTYAAPPECPDRAQFVEAVAQRGGALENGETGVAMAASISRAASGFDGAFVVERAGMESSARRVHGATCAEVVDALAVVAALALRSSEESPPRAPEPASPSEVEPAPVPEPRAPVAPEPKVRDAERPPLKAAHSWPVPFQPGSAQIHVESGTLRLESVTSLSLFGGLAFGVVPGVAMPRFELALSRANFVTLPSGDSYIIGPVWRARFTLLGNVDRRSADSSTRVGGQFIGFGPCFAPVFDSGGLELMSCLEIGAGLLALETRDAAGATVQKKTLGLGTLGLSAEAAYALGRHFHVSLRLGADAATGPVSAERADGSRVFEASRLSGYGMLGLGGQF